MAEVLYTRRHWLRAALAQDLEALTIDDEQERAAAIEDWDALEAPEPETVVGRFAGAPGEECELVAVWLRGSADRRIMVALWRLPGLLGPALVEIIGLPAVPRRRSPAALARQLMRQALGREPRAWESNADWKG